MHEILTALHPGTRVLDLGSGRGSFDATPYDLRIVRADIVPPAERCAGFVACSASQLPFAGAVFPGRHSEP